MGQADVGNRWCLFPTRSYTAKIFALADFAPFLRRIIFIGEPPLGETLNFEGVSLRAVRLSIFRPHVEGVLAPLSFAERSLELAGFSGMPVAQ